MNSKNYTNKTVSLENAARAKKLGYSFNEYVNYLIALSEQEKTTETADQLERLRALEGAVNSLNEALKSQRFLTDTQSKKIEQQLELNEQMATMLNKLLNAYGADIEFIQALKKEITA